MARLILGICIVVVAAGGCATGYKVEVLVPGYGFNGIHGISFDAQDRLYVGSVIGQSIYRVDTETGESETFIGPPSGMADDLEFAPDGTLAWTSFTIGKVHAMAPGGPVRVIAAGLPGINSIAFKQDGRLFATQVFLGDALYEIDLDGVDAPRKIIEGMGGLNGFDFGPDGDLYGPLWFKGQVARVNVDTGKLTVVAEGFKTPAAVNFDSVGNLYVLDTEDGAIFRVDMERGVNVLVARIKTAADNIGFDSNDNLYVTIIPENAIYQVDTETGDLRKVKEGRFSVTCDIAVRTDGGVDTLYLADLFDYRAVTGAEGAPIYTARSFGDELDYPIGVAASEKHVWFASWFSGALQKVDRATGKSLELWHGFNAPTDLVEMPGGELIVAELPTGNLLRVTGPEPNQREIVAEGMGGVAALAIAGPGAVYASEVFTGTISRVDLETGKRTVIAEGLEGPEGIGVAPDGRIVVAEVGRQRLVVIDPATGAIEVIAEGLPIGLPAPEGAPPMFVPTGVAVSDSGTIYVTSDLEDAIYKITPR